MSDTTVRIRPDQVPVLDKFAHEASRSRSNAVQWLIDETLRHRTEPTIEEDTE